MARRLACALLGATALTMKTQTGTLPSCEGEETPHLDTGCDNGNDLKDCETLYTKVHDNFFRQCKKTGNNCLAGGLRCDPKPASVWKLALNVNPSDGNNFGYGGPWATDALVGSADEALSKDFKDNVVMKTKAKYLAIARHVDKKCEAVRVWELANPDTTLLQRFQDAAGRNTASTGGPVFEYMKPGMSGSATDPIFATKGKLMTNWWYSNNGARIALEDGSHYKGLLPQVSPENRNDDDVHGLGNEFGANTKGGQGSPSWWHDAAQKMTGDCHGGNCKMIGKDHGTSLSDGDYYGNYAVYLTSDDKAFPCEGATLDVTM
ncbi:unnamed protein product [Symbiodinium pilosum]|uniref:Uncharacterized protein n=1 Tax=Symbiodinium pilosum TaxID=2952 RepID=A0A812KKF1_SYMPI|nr:unnamed protein product [Symbiodinium pilosum]